jgi:hypothetical protein
MPLLLIPLGLALLVALWLLTLPLAVWQRYRRGRARRRARPWAVRANAWSLLLSAALFMLGAWFATLWIDGALAYAALGLSAGLVVGWLGLYIARIEHESEAIFHTPNRWLVLVLTAAVAARIGYGLWHLTQWQADAGHAAWLARQGGLLAFGGLLLGYHLGYAWALRRRIGRGAPVLRY